MIGYFYAYVCGCVADSLGHRRNLARLSWALSLCLVGPAFGQAVPSWSLVPKAAETATGVSYSYAPTATGNAVTTVGRAVSTAANDAFVAAESATLSTPAGQATVNLARGFTGAVGRSALADAALAIGRGGLVGAAIGAAAALGPVLESWMLAQGYHKNADGSWGVGVVGPAPTTPSGVGGSPYWCYTTSCAPIVTTNEAAVLNSIKAVYPNWITFYYCGYAQNYDWALDPPGSTSTCVRVKLRSADGNSSSLQEVSVYRHAAGTQTCPDGTVPISGSCGGGTGPSGPPSLSPDDVHAAAAAAPNPSVSDWQTTFDNAAAIGYAPALPDTPVVTGPAEVVGPSSVVSTSTITKPDGSTQTLSQSQYQVSKLTYNGSQVALQTNVVNTAQNPDGSTTKTEKPVATAPDACAGFAGILGCTQLGTPESASVPTSSKSIAFTAESISLPSACPASIQVSRFGSLSFQPACDAAGYMRPLILAGSAIAALMICVAAVAGVKT